MRPQAGWSLPKFSEPLPPAPLGPRIGAMPLLSRNSPLGCSVLSEGGKGNIAYCTRYTCASVREPSRYSPAGSGPERGRRCTPFLVICASIVRELPLTM